MADATTTDINAVRGFTTVAPLKFWPAVVTTAALVVVTTAALVVVVTAALVVVVTAVPVVVVAKLPMTPL